MWYIFVLLLALGCLGPIQAGEKVGIRPFKGYIVKVAKCEKSTYQMYDKSRMILYLELYNTSTQHDLLRGNLTVTKEIKNVKIQVKSYMWENNKWSPFYVINNMACHRLAQPVFSMSGIKYDFKTCSFLKGSFSFSDIDINKYLHLMPSALEYGRLMWRNELVVDRRTLYCWQFEAVVVPARATEGAKGA